MYWRKFGRRMLFDIFFFIIWFRYRMIFMWFIMFDWFWFGKKICEIRCLWCIFIRSGSVWFIRDIRVKIWVGRCCRWILISSRMRKRWSRLLFWVRIIVRVRMLERGRVCVRCWVVFWSGRGIGGIIILLKWIELRFIRLWVIIRIGSILVWIGVSWIC